MLIIIEPRPSELCSRGRPQISPVTLGSAKGPVVKQFNVPWPFLPRRLSQHATHWP